MNTKQMLSVIATLSFTAAAHANLELPVIRNYDQASNAAIWAKASTDFIPEVLMKTEKMNRPVSAYASTFPKAFLQEEMFAVCYKSCNDKDVFSIGKGENIQIKPGWMNGNDVIEQTNVYFWMNNYYRFLKERFYFEPDQYLKVMTNRPVEDETNGKKLTNNAFFNPRDVTLSFLPADRSLMFKLSGGKINRSGFDPSVVAHEASHYFFHHLFPHAVNNEIGGLNEGFADYIANIILENPKVGLVMLQGKALRDASAGLDRTNNFKTYSPKMEVHDLGERVSTALWKSRELSADKKEFDRIVVDAVIELAQNPYSAIHDFKAIMLKRLPSVINAQNLTSAEIIWETIFPGKATKVANLNFLDKSPISKEFIGFDVKNTVSKQIASDMGVPEITKFNFTILKEVSISGKQKAFLAALETGTETTPYWITFDLERANILSIHSIDKKIVTEEEEISRIEQMIPHLADRTSILTEFQTKIRSFIALNQGQGDYSAVYGVTKRKVQSESRIFNGAPVQAKRHILTVEKRLLGKLIPGGIMDLAGLELITVPKDVSSSTDEFKGETVIGYNIRLGTGTQIEMIISKNSK